MKTKETVIIVHGTWAAPQTAQSQSWINPLVHWRVGPSIPRERRR